MGEGQKYARKYVGVGTWIDICYHNSVQVSFCILKNSMGQ